MDAESAAASASAAFAKEDWDSVLNYTAIVLSADKRNIVALSQRGTAASALGDAKSAIKYYTKALDAAHKVRAHAGAGAASIDEAALATLYFNRGVAYRNARNADAAIADFSMALELDPSDERSIVLRAVTLRTLKRYSEALADYETALKLNPSSGEAHYGRSRVLMRLSKDEERLAELRLAVKYDPDNESYAAELKLAEAAVSEASEVSSAGGAVVVPRAPTRGSFSDRKGTGPSVPAVSMMKVPSTGGSVVMRSPRVLEKADVSEDGEESGDADEPEEDVADVQYEILLPDGEKAGKKGSKKKAPRPKKKAGGKKGSSLGSKVLSDEEAELRILGRRAANEGRAFRVRAVGANDDPRFSFQRDESFVVVGAKDNGATWIGVHKGKKGEFAASLVIPMDGDEGPLAALTNGAKSPKSAANDSSSESSSSDDDDPRFRPPPGVIVDGDYPPQSASMDHYPPQSAADGMTDNYPPAAAVDDAVLPGGVPAVPSHIAKAAGVKGGRKEGASGAAGDDSKKGAGKTLKRMMKLGK
jgi:tetratricopeptide (TPR) repeat protein